MTVAALFVDPRGPYPKLLGAENCWDEARDARKYTGPGPVVAHPPCGPYSRLRAFCKHQPADCAPIAVDQVRRFGGVLEHPASSTLWQKCALPTPDGLPDAWGGWSVEVDQVSWGHRARKRTWLYVVGVKRSAVKILRGGTPTHCVTRNHESSLKKMSSAACRRTPLAFANFLVGIAKLAVVEVRGDADG